MSTYLPFIYFSIFVPLIILDDGTFEDFCSSCKISQNIGSLDRIVLNNLQPT